MENSNLTAVADLLPDDMASSQIMTSDADILEQKVLWLNETPGELTGYDCPLCKNRGDSAYVVNGEIVYRPCKCLKIRSCLRNIRESGLEPLLGEKTFEAYYVREDWQRLVKQRVQEYVQDETGAWMVLTGCQGSGKTHLCTAACGELLKNGIAVRYMLWIDEIQRLKAAKTDERYAEMMKPWKQAEVLYIDDLFKTKRGEEVSGPDVRLAFELINYRYIDPKKRTIISSEKTLDEIINLDQALGGRLREKSKGFYGSSVERVGRKN